MQKRHIRQQKILNIPAYAGYLILTILVLQAVSLIVISALQYGIFNHITITDTTTTGGLITETTTSYTAAFTAIKPKEPNVFFIASLWTTLIATLVLLSILITNALSHIVHSLLKRRNKETIGNLFFVKLMSAIGAFVIILVAASLLPAVQHLLGINTVLTVSCVVFFWLQHYVSARSAQSIKHVL